MLVIRKRLSSRCRRQPRLKPIRLTLLKQAPNWRPRNTSWVKVLKMPTTMSIPTSWTWRKRRISRILRTWRSRRNNCRWWITCWLSTISKGANSNRADPHRCPCNSSSSSQARSRIRPTECLADKVEPMSQIWLHSLWQDHRTSNLRCRKTRLMSTSLDQYLQINRLTTYMKT